MDARPHLIAIITVLFLLIALPSCQRQSVSPGGLPPGPPSGGGGSVGATQPTSTPIFTQATIIPALPTQTLASPPNILTSPPNILTSPPNIPTSPPSAPVGGGASIQQTVIASATPQPAQPAPTADIACNVKGVHIVKQGENLYRISLRYRMSTEGLARMNNIWDPNYLRVGQRLQTLSCYTVRSYGWWVWERSPIPPSAVIDSDMVGSSTYIVQQGDTLYRIAVRFNTTVRDLIIANGLPNENVAAGQRLFVQ